MHFSLEVELLDPLPTGRRREMHQIRSVNESSAPLDLSFPVDLSLPVDSQFSVNPRRSTIFGLPQHRP